MHAALVHVGRQHFDSLGPRLVDVLTEFRGIGHVVRHHGAVKLHRIIRFQISRLIRDNGVGGGVGFVEAVTGEFFEQIENLVRLGLRDIVLLLATLDENGALPGHFFGLFLAHRAAQQVRAAQSVACQHLRGLHHLLLINQNTVGLARNRFEQRMFVFDIHFAVAAPDEFGDQVHRSRTVERHQRGDVFHRTDLKFAAEIAHPARFQLENAERVRLVQQIVRPGVVERQIVDGHLDAFDLPDHFARVANDRERFQPQKIHLQQTEVADRPHRVLGYNGAVVVRLQRQQVDERLVADDDARGVHGGVAREVFENERGVDEFARGFLVFVSLFEFRRDL